MLTAQNRQFLHTVECWFRGTRIGSNLDTCLLGVGPESGVMGTCSDSLFADSGSFCRLPCATSLRMLLIH